MHTLYTITAHHIAILRGVSYNTARKERAIIMASLDVQVLYLRDVASYYGIPTLELAERLYVPKKKMAA